MPDLSKFQDSFRTFARFRVVEPLRYGAGVFRTTLNQSAGRPLKVLLVSDNEAYTSEEQFSPLVADRELFRTQLGIIFHRQLLSDTLLLPKRLLSLYDVVGLKIGFRTAPEEVLRITRVIKNALSPGAKLVYFDGDDDLCVQWPDLLPLVDLYVKKHIFSDPSEYLKERIGKTNLTDYVARKFGTSFADDIIPKGTPASEEQIHKIVLGWNIGLDSDMRSFYAAHRNPPATSSKDVDVVCRASANPNVWIAPFRTRVTSEINALGPEHNVLTPEVRVPQDVYFQEMLRSRICVSPFGYGELCWRDFEAIMCGCVLVKPDMSHVKTRPDIFVPNETYVPVQWDYSDLGAKLKELLANPKQCEALRTNASRVLRDFYEGHGVLDAFAEIIQRLGLEHYASARA